MAGLPGDDFRIVSELGRIAAGTGPVEQRATAVLDTLRRLVPFQAAVVQLLDPDRGLVTPVAGRGYGPAVSKYMDSSASTEEIELLGLTRDRTARRVRDLPVPADRVRSWVEFLEPAGFREGLAVGLFTPGGRHLGVLGLNTDTERIRPKPPAISSGSWPRRSPRRSIPSGHWPDWPGWSDPRGPGSC